VDHKILLILVCKLLIAGCLLLGKFELIALEIFKYWVLSVESGLLLWIMLVYQGVEEVFPPEVCRLAASGIDRTFNNWGEGGDVCTCLQQQACSHACWNQGQDGGRRTVLLRHPKRLHHQLQLVHFVPGRWCQCVHVEHCFRFLLQFRVEETV